MIYSDISIRYRTPSMMQSDVFLSVAAEFSSQLLLLQESRNAVGWAT